MESFENQENKPSKNPEMESLKQSLEDEFLDIEFLNEWPASNPDAEKTNVVWKYGNDYIKGFTKTWRILWETEYKLIDLFNHFSVKNNSKFSWPDVSEIWETEDGWYYLWMKDAKQWGLKELDFSKMSPEEIMDLYCKYRQIFDDFEKYSKWKTSSKSKIQSMYSLYKKFLQSKELSQSATRTSKVINWAKKSLCNVLQPAFKLVLSRKYKNLVNERITNGEGVVRACGIDVDRGKLNDALDKLLSMVKNLDFEYNFWRFWTWHVFSNWETHKFVDFDNVGYQIKWTELIGIMWSNLLNWVWNYKSYEDWKKIFDNWYNKLVETYKDENLVKLLLFVKLVWTVFEDYWNLIYKREYWREKEWQKNGNFDEIKKWVEWNYRALQELI